MFIFSTTSILFSNLLSSFLSKLRLFLSLFGLLFCFFNLFTLTLLKAQETSNTKEKTISLKKVNVIYTPISASIYPSKVTQIITSDDIKQSGARSVAEILTLQSNITIDTMGSLGQPSRVKLNGLRTKDVAILLDGVKLQEASNIEGFFDIGQLPVFMIERIEIISGPASVLYGSSAIAGAINIITKQAPGNLFVFNQEIGNKDTFKTQLALATKINKLSLMAFGTFFNTAGFNLSQDSPYAHEENDGTLIQDGNLKIKYDFTPTTYVELFYKNNYSKANYDGFSNVTNKASDKSDYYSLNYNQIGYGRLGFNIFDNFSNEIIFSALDVKRTYYQDQYISDYYGLEKIFNYKGNVHYRFINAIFGIEAENKEAIIFKQKNTVDNLAYFITVSEYIFDKLSFDQGIRFNQYKKDNITPKITYTYNLGFSYELMENSALKVNYGSGFNLPTIYQLYSPYGVNTELKEEESQGVTLGVITTHLNNYINKVEATLFYNQIDNLISYQSGFNQSQPYLSQYMNVGDYENYGVNLATYLNIKSLGRADLTFNPSYTYVHSKNMLTNEVAPKTPSHKLNLNLLYNLQKYSFLLSTITTSKVVDGFAGSFHTLKGYTVLNLNLGYDLTKKSNIYINVANVFDTKYVTNYGYQSAPRTFYAGFLYNL